MTNSYSIWTDHDEQWDRDDIDKPTFTCLADSAADAIDEFFAVVDDGDRDYGKYIVRNDDKDTYRIIELVRDWKIMSDRPTSLEELSAP